MADLSVSKVLSAIVVDEWGMVREGLCAVLDQARITTLGRTSTATAAWSILADGEVDLVVLGSFADAAQADAVRRARHLAPDSRIVVLVTNADQAGVMELFSAGADALVARSADEASLCDAVDHAVRGQRYLAPALLTLMFGHTPSATLIDPSRSARLTDREHAVLRLVANGRTNREIADALCIGSETVKTHLTNVYAKLDVNRRHDAVGVAIQHGLI
jgi:DNA-binding NarL/FixJ family response regulator